MTSLARLAAAACATVALLLPTSALADTCAYGVRGHIAIDQRSPDEMRSQPGACPMSQACSTRSDAETCARRSFGGVGGTCSCR